MLNQGNSRWSLATFGGITVIAAFAFAPPAQADLLSESAATATVQLANSANLSTPRLWLGDRRPAVRQLQQMLRANGFLAREATGAFDRATQQAVRELQAFANLPVDGVVGNATWDALIRMTDPYNVNLTSIL